MKKLIYLLLLAGLLVSCKTQTRIITQTEVVKDTVYIPTDTVIYNSIIKIEQVNNTNQEYIDSLKNTVLDSLQQHLVNQLEAGNKELADKLDALKRYVLKPRYIAVDKYINTTTVVPTQTKSEPKINVYVLLIIVIVGFIGYKWLCKFF